MIAPMNTGDATVDLAAAKLAYDALKFAYGILKDVRLGKKDKRKIDAEVEKLVVLAQPSDIDKEVKRRRGRPGHIRYMTGAVTRRRRLVGAKVKKTAPTRRRVTNTTKKRRSFRA
jgi:hypothetical protein